MKKQIVQTMIVLAGLMVLMFYGISGASVVDSPHNFSSESYYGTLYGDSDEVCIYCHTPHNALALAGQSFPLWNRTWDPARTYTMYGVDSATFDADTVEPTYNRPTGTSLLCLSCHDGVTAFGGTSIINYSQVAIGPFKPYAKFDDITSFSDWANPNIGWNLSNDHPVSFEYSVGLIAADAATNNNVPGLRSLTDVKTLTPALKFSGASRERLECTTCHDPHEYGLDLVGDPPAPSKTPFLRMNNAGSAMCRACHLK